MNYFGLFAFVTLAINASGCAVNSGVVQMNESTYMLSKQAATGFHGMGNLKADAVQEARNFCLDIGKELNLIKTEDAQPPFILGNFPKTDIFFECTDSSRIEAKESGNPSI